MLSDRLCACGCGQRTTFAVAPRREYGIRPGDPNVYVLGHRAQRNSKGYRRRKIGVPKPNGDALHRLRAERAIGKPLPAGSIVHHADGSTSEHAPLVICQDERYHRLLHARTRIVRAGGNPNTEGLCSACGLVKPRREFWGAANCSLGIQGRCQTCIRESRRG